MLETYFPRLETLISLEAKIKTLMWWYARTYTSLSVTRRIDKIIYPVNTDGTKRTTYPETDEINNYTRTAEPSVAREYKHTYASACWQDLRVPGQRRPAYSNTITTTIIIMYTNDFHRKGRLYIVKLFADDVEQVLIYTECLLTL
jgi:hypothetical protein